jgi:Domain of unknown function (DUF4416)
LSTPTIPDPARLVLSVLTTGMQALEEARPLLVKELGEIEKEIGPLAFDFTSYYDVELGTGIKRWIWSFVGLKDRAELAKIKCLTNEIEQAYTVNGRRRFNLDPGFLTLENFVLATGKNRSHRIYLASGIFADLTLEFRQGTYRPLKWTFPDYADPELIGILNLLRESYKCQLRNQEPKTGS